MNQVMNPASSGTARDPVCGMRVDPATAAGRFDHDGQTYYFCCQGCLEKFRAAPDTFLHPPTPAPLVRLRRGPTASAHTPGVDQAHHGQHHGGNAPATAAATAPAGTIWVCPMDPEVRQDHPGACPK